MVHARNHQVRSIRAKRTRVAVSKSSHPKLNIPNPMSDALEKIESQAADDLKALLREAEQALGNTAGEAGEKFDDLRGRLRSALDNGRFIFAQLRRSARAAI